MIRSYRFLTAALMGSPVFIGIALSFTVTSTSTDRDGNAVRTHPPGAWMYLVVVAVAVASAVLTQLLGYRLPALSPNVEPRLARQRALQLYQQTMFLRFAFGEAVVIVSVALLFAGHSNTIRPYVLGAALAELLIFYHVWPSDSLISRVQEKLDRNGGRSDLANALNGIPAS